MNEASVGDAEKSAHMELKVEVNERHVKPEPGIDLGSTVVLFTPPVGPEYWWFRVRVSEKQAIQAFPKFGTVGIGFAVEEEDWNTNLPYTTHARDIYNHISDNKGDDSISEATCVRAIEMLQDVIRRTGWSR